MKGYIIEAWRDCYNDNLCNGFLVVYRQKYLKIYFMFFCNL